MKEKRRDARLFERLLFIKYLYEGDTVPEACDRLEIVKATGYDWLERWNADGIDGLRPAFGGGRPSKLTDNELDELKELLEERDDWTTREVHQLIRDRFDVEYTERNVYKILRKLGMTFSKPYQSDYRRPDDAEHRLKKT